MKTITKQISKIALFNQSQVARIMGQDRSVIATGYKDKKSSIEAITEPIEKVKDSIRSFATSGSFKPLQDLARLPLVSFGKIKTFLSEYGILITLVSSPTRHVNTEIKKKLVRVLFQEILDLNMVIVEKEEVDFIYCEVNVLTLNDDFERLFGEYFHLIAHPSALQYTLGLLTTKSNFIDAMYRIVERFVSKNPEYINCSIPVLGYTPVMEIALPNGEQIFLHEKPKKKRIETPVWLNGFHILVDGRYLVLFNTKEDEPVIIQVLNDRIVGNKYHEWSTRGFHSDFHNLIESITKI